MSERNFWNYIRKSLPDLKMYRVENRVAEGMPDVHYLRDGSSGWIELKYLADWPDKKLSIGLRTGQSIWLDDYAKNNGQCWILLRVGRDFIGLIHGEHAQRLVEKVDVPEFLDCLTYKKFGQMSAADWEELADIITDQ